MYRNAEVLVKGGLARLGRVESCKSWRFSRGYARERGRSRKPAKEGKQAQTVFDIRKDLENIEVLEFDEIFAQSRERLKKDFVGPNESVRTRIAKYEYGSSSDSVKVTPYHYLLARLSPGDVVLLQPLYAFGASVLSELAVILKMPLYEGDNQFLFLTQKGMIVEASKLKIHFRIGTVFEPDMIRDSLIEKPTEPGGPATTVRNGELCFAEDRYSVPESARRIIMKKLHLLSAESWSKLPKQLTKLEIISRLLQISGVEAVSILDLDAMVRCFSFDDFKQMVTDNHTNQYGLVKSRVEAFKRLEQMFETLFRYRQGQLNMGFEPTAVGRKLYSGSTLLSLFMGLKKQTQLWTLRSEQIGNNIRTPLVVRVKPLHKQLMSPKDPALQDSFESIVEYINGKLGPRASEASGGSGGSDMFQPAALGPVLEMVKEYSAGNIDNDEHESFVLNLLRKIKLFENMDKVNRSCAFHVLEKVGYFADKQSGLLVDQNPNLWSHNLQIPYLKTGSSEIVDLEQQYYDSLTEHDLDKTDPLESVRHDFGNLPVFCIDAADAHEIDDGISIEHKSEHEWLVHVHIANPASYFPPDSKLAHIGCKRATTVYLTETVVPMLPGVVSRVSGLNSPGKPTRTITYSLSYNTQTHKVTLLPVTAGLVRNINKLTYSQVDDILQDKTESPYKTDLKHLAGLSNHLKKTRLANGALDIDFEHIAVKNNNNTVELVTSSTTASQILVSELMIHANKIAGDFNVFNRIPCYFRNLPPVLGFHESRNLVSQPDRLSIYEYYKRLQSRSVLGTPITYPELMQLVTLLQTGYYSQNSYGHLFLAITHYCPSTSPLRRYGDLVNQWQLHSFLLKKPLPFDSKSILAQVVHYQYRQEMAKLAQRNSEIYWKLRLVINKLNGNDPSFDNMININYNSPENTFSLLVTKLDDTDIDGRWGVGILMDYQVNALLKTDDIVNFPKEGGQIKVRIDYISPVDLEIHVSMIQ